MTDYTELAAAHAESTPGPWPWEYSGDGKRIVIGKGLVEGPNGYEVAEVYSDDCPCEVAEANARFIALAHRDVPGLIAQVRAHDTILIDLAASLAAAISLLERGGKAAKKAASSDRMFDLMVMDYKASLARARAVLGAEQ